MGSVGIVGVRGLWSGGEPRFAQTLGPLCADGGEAVDEDLPGDGGEGREGATKGVVVVLKCLEVLGGTGIEPSAPREEPEARRSAKSNIIAISGY